jgi:pilus assembly protein CpaF
MSEGSEPQQVQNIYASSIQAMLKPIEPLLKHPKITEVMINGPNEIFIEMEGRLHKTDAKFASEDDLLAACRVIGQFVGKIFDVQRPRMDARLPDGSRVHAVMPPVSRRGICVAIRRFSAKRLTIDDLVKFKSLTPDAVELLRVCVMMKKNLVMSGGTGTGKTTILNCITGLIPQEERVLILEDTHEIQADADNLVYLETRAPDEKGRYEVTMTDLLHSSLRMRPDRIIIGECRGGEALELLNAMNSGHGGSMTTVHSNSATQALQKLETLVLYAGFDLPIHVVRAMVSMAMEIVVQANRMRDGSRRITSIGQVMPLNDAGMYTTRNIFEFAYKGRDKNGAVMGQLELKNIPTWIDEIEPKGIDYDKSIFQKKT